jgi:hypothetical protein
MNTLGSRSRRASATSFFGGSGRDASDIVVSAHYPGQRGSASASVTRRSGRGRPPSGRPDPAATSRAEPSGEGSPGGLPPGARRLRASGGLGEPRGAPGRGSARRARAARFRWGRCGLRWAADGASDQATAEEASPSPRWKQHPSALQNAIGDSFRGRPTPSPAHKALASPVEPDSPGSAGGQARTPLKARDSTQRRRDAKKTRIVFASLGESVGLRGLG